NVFVIGFCAAFEERYEYHPPSLLSVIEPTRADIDVMRVKSWGNSFVAGTGSRWTRGKKCFIMNSGPRVLTLNVSSASRYDTFVTVFSGNSFKVNDIMETST